MTPRSPSCRLNLAGGHLGRGEADDVERADEVDRDDLGEDVERVWPLLADDPIGDADARAVHDALQAAKCALRQRQRLLDALLVGHIRLREAGARTKLLGQRLATLFVQIGDDHVRAARDEGPRAGRAKSRRSAGDEKCRAVESHLALSLMCRGDCRLGAL